MLKEVKELWNYTKKNNNKVTFLTMLYVIFVTVIAIFATYRHDDIATVLIYLFG